MVESRAIAWFVPLLERRGIRFGPVMAVSSVVSPRCRQTYEENIARRCHQHRRQHNQGKLDNIEILIVYILGRNTSHDVASGFHCHFVNPDFLEFGISRLLTARGKDHHSPYPTPVP